MQSASDIIKQLSTADIDKRIAQLEGERKALIVLRRAALVNERRVRLSHNGQTPKGGGK